MGVANPGRSRVLHQSPEDSLVARHRAGMRGGGRGAGAGLAHLQHGHPDATLGADRKGLRQSGAVAVLLQEESDRSDSLPASQRRQPVAGVQHRLVARGDQRVKVDPAPRADRIDGEVPALGDHPHRTGAELRHRVSPERRPGRYGDHPVAVRAAERDPCPGGDLLQLALEFGSARCLAEPGGDDDRSAATALGRLGERGRDLGGWNCEDDRVHRLRQIRR